MKLLALCGSLRAASINAALLRTAATLSPLGLEIEISRHPGALPLFNPDLEGEPPAVVVAFRAQVLAADALLIASPEYAHGITGVMKNALDWLVSIENFAGKPVAVWNASPRSVFSDASLREILRTMAAEIIEEASIALPLVGAGLDEEGMLRTPAVVAAIAAALARIKAAQAAPAVGAAN
ncbi:MAG TPA: NADPH-dependent FMN reductase [Burkholderiales bacterium]|jgi:NAD(P)H-dependent FMN reductase|nr:NADPH-dependent FMN reductase [Burkholderiales bacterium]